MHRCVLITRRLDHLAANGRWAQRTGLVSLNNVQLTDAPRHNMDSKPFSIEANRFLRRITFVFKGFWSPDVLESFQAEARSAVRPWTWASGEHTVLIDVSDFPIQSQLVFTALSSMIDDDPSKPRRLALVSGSGLARMQFRRAQRRESVRLFDTRAVAEEWLNEPSERPGGQGRVHSATPGSRSPNA